MECESKPQPWTELECLFQPESGTQPQPRTESESDPVPDQVRRERSAAPPEAPYASIEGDHTELEEISAALLATEGTLCVRTPAFPDPPTEQTLLPSNPVSSRSIPLTSRLHPSTCNFHGSNLVLQVRYLCVAATDASPPILYITVTSQRGVPAPRNYVRFGPNVRFQTRGSFQACNRAAV